MSALDGKRIWVDHISQVPELLNLKKIDPDSFNTIERCEGAQADFKRLMKKDRRFFSTGAKILCCLESFQDGAPLEFIVPKQSFAAPAALIYRAPRRFLGGLLVTETLLLPVETGLLQAGIWRRWQYTYPTELQSAHIHRIGCYYESWPILLPSRGKVYERAK